MVTAWEVPKNPLTDTSLDESPLSKQIRWGYQIFVDTPQQATRFAPSKVSCANCHLNAGQRERALPLVGLAGVFPEYNARAGRLISLADRIVECFNRSENGTGRLVSGSDPGAGDETAEALPSPTSKEVLALSAYITWLGKGYPVGQSPAWRGRNSIAENARIPVDRLDPQKGRDLYLEKCVTCHGSDGQGVQIGDKKAGPLWGPDSWNDGAGAARVYTLAGIIRYTMPYLDPGSLTYEDAMLVAAFITSQRGPQYPFKETYYLWASVRAFDVYYEKRR
jgi:thiosulfate dehydrogenase